MSAVIDPQAAANTKLPLWDTIGRSYSTYVNNLVDVLRICWLWLVVGAVLGGIASWVQWSWLIGTLAELKRGISPQMQPFRVSMPIGMFVLLYGTSLLWILAGVSIAVADIGASYWANDRDLAAATSLRPAYGVIWAWDWRSV